MKTHGDFLRSEPVANRNGRKGKTLAVSYGVRIVGDPVGTAERGIMDCFQQIGFARAVPAEKQIDRRVRQEDQILIISEVFQFQFFNLHSSTVLFPFDDISG